MTITNPVPEARLVPLHELGLAPENSRAKQPRDEGVAGLAETIAVAGLVVPLAVRPGRKGERAFMALDGRRRLFALEDLAAAERLPADWPVRCEVFETPAAQAAAAVLTATERVPVHAADVIVAIGQLRKRRMETSAIAAALGYDELEIKRLEALAGVHAKVLAAYRNGRLTQRQVRLLARLGDKGQQAEFGQAALDGYFNDYRLQDLVAVDRVGTDDPRLSLVGLERYAAAGGRIERDLFGELPDRLLDPELLQELWRERLEPIVEGLQAKGLAVFAAREPGYRPPDGFERLPYVYGRQAPEVHSRIAAAEARASESEAAVDLVSDAPTDSVVAMICAQRAAVEAPFEGQSIGAVILSPDDRRGVNAAFFVHPAPEEPEVSGGDEVGDERSDLGALAPEVEVPEPEVDTEGVSHALHETRTDVATRGLIRDLVDRPGAALTVLIAHLFQQVALNRPGGDTALAISAKGYRRGGRSPIAGLDGEVRERLEAWRVVYKASGLRPIPFVAQLPEDEKLALLAAAVALTLDLCEARTESLRAAARAEAAEIATLCEANLSVHWTPDAGFLAAHSKAQLLTMLDDMGETDPGAKSLKKADLTPRVAEAALTRQWTPPALSWVRVVEPEAREEPVEPRAEAPAQAA